MLRVSLTVLGALLIASTSAFAAPATNGTTRLLYQPPYHGTALNKTKFGLGGCGTSANHTRPAFDLMTGNSTGATSISAYSCSPSASGGASASDRAYGAEVGVLLPSFTKRGGSQTISATFHVDLDIKISMSGASCTDAGQFARAYWAAEADLVNWSNAGLVTLGAKHQGGDVLISQTKSVTTSFNFSHTLSWTVVLGKADTYAVTFAFLYNLAVTVNNPSTKDPDSCTADASLVPGSGGSGAGDIVLTDVIVI